MTLQRPYYLGAALLLLVEASIALLLFVHDSFVRPHGGDFLAAIFLFCLLRSVWAWPVFKPEVLTLLLAYAVELSQSVHPLHYVGWQHSQLARVVLQRFRSRYTGAGSSANCVVRVPAPSYRNDWRGGTNCKVRATVHRPRICSRQPV
ncbi:ribosomal maturation YjgA family protein [Hymenobacter rubidus]|uniref:ribosomal maturation YjgA family protein n=1 Tax=Hymenobacter rubidus TaxID=1441626 RepID=UPI0037440770